MGRIFLLRPGDKGLGAEIDYSWVVAELLQMVKINRPSPVMCRQIDLAAVKYVFRTSVSYAAEKIILSADRIRVDSYELPFRPSAELWRRELQALAAEQLASGSRDLGAFMVFTNLLSVGMTETTPTDLASSDEIFRELLADGEVWATRQQTGLARLRQVVNRKLDAEVRALEREHGLGAYGPHTRVVSPEGMIQIGMLVRGKAGLEAKRYDRRHYAAVLSQRKTKQELSDLSAKDQALLRVALVPEDPESWILLGQAALDEGPLVFQVFNNLTGEKSLIESHGNLDQARRCGKLAVELGRRQGRTDREVESFNHRVTKIFERICRQGVAVLS